MKTLSIIFFNLIVILLWACASSRPLTEEEKKVRLVAGTKEDTVNLSERCKEYPGIHKLPASELAIREFAVQKNRNTAQLIYLQSIQTDWIYSQTVDVKLWQCP